jgi:hypothetical protein
MLSCFAGTLPEVPNLREGLVLSYSGCSPVEGSEGDVREE